MDGPKEIGGRKSGSWQWCSRTSASGRGVQSPPKRLRCEASKGVGRRCAASRVTVDRGDGDDNSRRCTSLACRYKCAALLSAVDDGGGADR